MKTACFEQCRRMKAETHRWIEFVRGLDISKLTDEELTEICSVVTYATVLHRGARIQAIFFAACQREEEKHGAVNADPEPVVVTQVHKVCVACGGSGVSSSGRVCRACSGKQASATPPQASVTPPQAPVTPLLDLIDTQVLQASEQALQASEQALQASEPPKRRRGRPKKKEVVQEEAQEVAQEVAQEDVPEIAKEGDGMTSEQEAERSAWAKERIRPDLLAPPFQDVETVDYFCSSILCDNPLCGRDNTVVRVPKDLSNITHKCYVQYRCSDCGERGQLLFSREELAEVFASERCVNYDVLIENNPKFFRAFKAAEEEFSVPRPRKIQVPRNKPKLLPQPIAKTIEITPIEENPKQFTPMILNDLDSVKSTDEAEKIIDAVLCSNVPASADLHITEEEISESLLAMPSELLISQWEAATGETWQEGQDLKGAALRVARSIVRDRGA